MALSEEERECVEAVCRYLDQTRGGTWKVPAGPTLDDQYPHEPSPEVLVTNDLANAAVEVKRLSDDTINEYLESVLTLKKKHLAPSCGGYYRLTPCPDVPLPMDRELMRHLKKQIECVAPGMQDKETRPVVIERSAPLKVDSWNGPSWIHCAGHNAFDLWNDFSHRLDGIYALLVDHDQLEHRFVTDARREQLFQTIIAAARSGQSQTIAWQEEWPLERINGNDTGVHVLGTSGAFDLPTSVSLSVERMLEKALEKFRGRRWAATHIIALESQSPHMTPDRVREALLAFDRDELQEVDLVLLVVDGEAQCVWPQ